jgi:hypothetical protein
MNEGILTVEKQVMRFGPQAGLQSRLMDMVGSIRNQERERALQRRNVLLNRQNFEYGGLAGLNRQQALSGGAPMDTELVAVTPQEKQMLQMFGPGYELDSGIKGYLPGFLKKIGKALKRAAPTILTIVGAAIGGPVGAGFGRALGGKIAGESTRDALLAGLSAGIGAQIGGMTTAGGERVFGDIASSAITGFFAGAPGGIKTAVRGAGYGALAGGIAKGFNMARQEGGKFTDAFKYKNVSGQDYQDVLSARRAQTAQEALVATGQPQGGPFPQDAGGATVDSLTGRGATVDSLTGQQTFQYKGQTLGVEEFAKLPRVSQNALLTDPQFVLDNINVMDTLKGLSEPSLLQKAISPFNFMDPYGFEERLGLGFSPTKLLSAGALITEGTKTPKLELTEEQEAMMRGPSEELIAQYSFAPVATSPYYGMPVYQPLVAGYADGGVVELDMREGGESVGPGTGTSDDIPAMLSDGEFVMTAKAVRGAGHGSREDGSKFMYGLMSLFEDMA